MQGRQDAGINFSSQRVSPSSSNPSSISSSRDTQNSNSYQPLSLTCVSLFSAISSCFVVFLISSSLQSLALGYFPLCVIENCVYRHRASLAASARSLCRHFICFFFRHIFIRSLSTVREWEREENTFFVFRFFCACCCCFFSRRNIFQAKKKRFFVYFYSSFCQFVRLTRDVKTQIWNYLRPRSLPWTFISLHQLLFLLLLWLSTRNWREENFGPASFFLKITLTKLFNANFLVVFNLFFAVFNSVLCSDNVKFFAKNHHFRGYANLRVSLAVSLLSLCFLWDQSEIVLKWKENLDILSG